MLSEEIKSVDREKEGLENVLRVLNIAEKKARIYSRLLTETSLAKAMEELACRYEDEKTTLQALLYGSTDKQNKKKERGMDEENAQ